MRHWDNLSAAIHLPLVAAALLTLAGPLMVGLVNVSPNLKAQSPAPRNFDVASIRPAAPNARGILIRPIAGGITITNIPLKELIVLAYGVQRYQVSGGPPWISSERYDISAKSENSPKRDEVPPMLQALLADRFQLRIHRETKELPIYTLVIARKDGKLGPNLVEAKGDSCTAFDPKQPLPPPAEPGKAPVLYCGGMAMRPNGLTAASIQISQLTQNFSRMLGRIVIDKTGLTGKYDVSMEWPPEALQSLQMSGAPPLSSSEAAPPSIFTLIQEQLGLKLEAQKGPVDTIVIDGVERPSAN